MRFENYYDTQMTKEMGDLFHCPKLDCYVKWRQICDLEGIKFERALYSLLDEECEKTRHYILQKAECDGTIPNFTKVIMDVIGICLKEENAKLLEFIMNLEEFKADILMLIIRHGEQKMFIESYPEDTSYKKWHDYLTLSIRLGLSAITEFLCSIPNAISHIKNFPEHTRFALYTRLFKCSNNWRSLRLYEVVWKLISGTESGNFTDGFILETLKHYIVFDSKISKNMARYIQGHVIQDECFLKHIIEKKSKNMLLSAHSHGLIKPFVIHWSDILQHENFRDLETKNIVYPIVLLSRYIDPVTLILMGFFNISSKQFLDTVSEKYNHTVNAPSNEFSPLEWVRQCGPEDETQYAMANKWKDLMCEWGPYASFDDILQEYDQLKEVRRHSLSGPFLNSHTTMGNTLSELEDAFSAPSCSNYFFEPREVEYMIEHKTHIWTRKTLDTKSIEDMKTWHARSRENRRRILKHATLDWLPLFKRASPERIENAFISHVLRKRACMNQEKRERFKRAYLNHSRNDIVLPSLFRKNVLVTLLASCTRKDRRLPVMVSEFMDHSRLVKEQDIFNNTIRQFAAEWETEAD